MRLLVVDDDRALRDVLRRALSLAGYEVRLTESGAGALSEISSNLPDAVVLDVGLPDIDGLEVCRLLRREGNRVPVLMLTARDAVSDRIDGLDAGADDYLVKPFDIDELKARLRALLRRAGGETSLDGTLTFADLRLDSARHGVMVGNNFVELTRTEYQLLELLMLNPRRVLPHTPNWALTFDSDDGDYCACSAARLKFSSSRRRSISRCVSGFAVQRTPNRSVACSP